MRFARRLGAALMVCAAVQVPHGTAHADHGDQFVNGALNTPTWKVCRSGVSAGVDATDRAMDLIDDSEADPTAVSCSSGNQNVSVWSTDSLYSTAYGRTDCTGTFNSTNHRCSSMTVFLYAATIATAPEPAKQWQKTACHELGHVGGLGHRPSGVLTSCLAQGDSPPIFTIYDSHDLHSLNDTYA